MTSEGNLQFPASSSILNPISLGGGPLPGGSMPPPNLLGNFQMAHTPSNGPNPGPAQGQLSQNLPTPSVLKLAGLPADISKREASLIFSLVSDDVLGIDLNEHENSVSVAFRNPHTCMTAGRLLDGRYIFGQSSGPAKVEYDSNIHLSGTNAAFESLRLSNSGVSPPTSSALPAQSAHQGPTGQPHLSSSQLQHGPSQGAENYQKRASIANQRSRFLFSDPFSGASTPASGNPGSIDLSDLTGKSLLFMNQGDGRDYESMPRDPWGSQSQGNLGFNSNPQTPGLGSVHSSYDWGSGAASNLSASANASSQSHQSSHNHQAPPLSASHSTSGTSQMPPFVTSAPSDRRRTSSFFNGPTAHPPSGHISQTQQQPPSAQQGQPSGPSSQTSRQHDQPHQPPALQAPQTVASIISQGPTLQHSGAANQQAVSSGATRNGPINSGSQNANSQAAGSAQAPTTTPTSSRSVSKDAPDLSLLARVPPPANPADQNPPCNTLYVGNLPPDATETELRSLFSPQKGFRRLSFRTKNQPSGNSNGSSNHNHGPMCFVEFEDVAHATIALAELYGRALPRPSGTNGKGGIRLSFSKNPLGVRGPGNPRRTSTNPQSSSTSNTSNGVGNYGYSNYN